MIICNLHHHFEKSHPNRRFHSIYWLALLFTADLSLQSDSTLIFRKLPTLLKESIHSIDKLKYDSIDYSLSFRKISPCWVISYYPLISCFVYIRIVPEIRLYNSFSKKPHPPVQVHTFHRSAVIWFYWFYTNILNPPPPVEWFHTIYWSAVSFTSDLFLK